MGPPPLPNRDLEHVKLLSIFYYVQSGLQVLSLGFFYLHYYFMKFVLAIPSQIEQSQGGMPLEMKHFSGLFLVIYGVMAFMVVVAAILNFMAAGKLRKMQHRTFCMVVAGLNCLQMPLGTALGVFTFMVLNREGTRRLFANPPASIS